MLFLKGTPVTPVTPATVVQGLPDPWVSQIANTDTLTAVAQILQSPQGQQVSSILVMLAMIWNLLYFPNVLFHNRPPKEYVFLFC